MATSKELLDLLKSSFSKVLEAERTRLETERDFLKSVRDRAGFGNRPGQFTNDAFSDLFLVEEIERFRLL